MNVVRRSPNGAAEVLLRFCCDIAPASATVTFDDLQVYTELHHHHDSDEWAASIAHRLRPSTGRGHRREAVAAAEVAPEVDGSCRARTTVFIGLFHSDLRFEIEQNVFLIGRINVGANDLSGRMR